MPRSMPAEEVRVEFQEAVDLAQSTDGIELVKASLSLDEKVLLDDYQLPRVIELGQILGENVFYGVMEETDDGIPEWSRLYFIRDGISHVQYIESLEMKQAREKETKDQVGGLERKEDLAEEILETYSEVLNDGQRYRLQHNIDGMTMDRLFSLQDHLQDKMERLEKEKRIDEKLEQELAEALVEEERFNRQFNEMDTEMLLKDMDIEFNEEEIRVGQVHQQAKSLLKIN